MEAVYELYSTLGTRGENWGRNYLDDFCHAIGELAGGQGLKESGINKDEFGLPERPDQIFAVGGVDRGFTPDARIDHRE